MKSLGRLADAISEFPGIGPRQARRVVQFLLSKSTSYRSELSKLIDTIDKDIASCTSCFRFDELNGGNLCSTCADENRDHESLMVVERDVDIDAIEGSSAYRGVYFVLGGLVSMVKKKKNGTGPRIKELSDRIDRNNLKEIIFALSTTPEGDYTAQELMKDVKEKSASLKVSILGRGLSVGAEIEYADSETLRNALKNRS